MMYSVAPGFEDILPKTSSERQDYFLKYAAKIAEKSIMEHKHGAIIVHENTIIATGYNYVYEHMCHNNSIHAEVDALMKVKSKGKNILGETEMYVVRIGSRRLQRPLKYSKPCCDCQKAIRKYGIPRVYYSTNDEYNTTVEHMNMQNDRMEYKIPNL